MILALLTNHESTIYLVVSVLVIFVVIHTSSVCDVPRVNEAYLVVLLEHVQPLYLV